MPVRLYWEMYNNEVRDGRQRGFWLINDEGRRQPVYFTLQKYYEEARVWVSDFLRQRRGLPSSIAFGQAAGGGCVDTPIRSSLPRNDRVTPQQPPRTGLLSISAPEIPRSA
jgi:hypothetical protein